jgi:pimeloyl-ACP methyl ester carboxylesterase
MLRILYCTIFLVFDLLILALYGIILTYKYIYSKFNKPKIVRTDYDDKTVLFMVHGSSADETQFILAKYMLGAIPTETINLRGDCVIEEFAEQIHQRIQELCIKSVILLGVSMGGLACSYYAHSVKHQINIKGIITIGTPFLGAPLLDYLSKNSLRHQQMSCGSNFLKDLNNSLSKISYPYLTFGSKVDLHVPDKYSIPLVKHAHYTLDYPGHIALTISPYIFRLVKKFYYDNLESKN